MKLSDRAEAWFNVILVVVIGYCIHFTVTGKTFKEPEKRVYSNAYPSEISGVDMLNESLCAKLSRAHSNPDNTKAERETYAHEWVKHCIDYSTWNGGR